MVRATLIFIRMMAFFGLVLGSLPLASYAQQLDETCVVNVLNRTIQVAPNGGWSMPNVPSTMGQVRARATCLQNGQTVSGQTEFFTVTRNGVVGTGDFRFGVSDPPPSLLTMTPAGSLSLNGQGTSQALSVLATFPDSTTRDVTTASSGMNYASTNPAIATVDANGLVTGLTTGTALITARLDGTIGLKQVTVIASGDSDGDGLPDDYEHANGLNPNDPVDAFEDQDGDGLTALAEFGLGTNPQNPDTDGDGITDDEEIVAGVDGFVTNPLLADTDGDGIPDGLEVSTGTDPTDPNSFNLAATLVSIDVTPALFVLSFNTILSEASQQLTVTGMLTDGTPIDLTSMARETTYSSSDISICSFGATDGEVFAGMDGACTVTVTNNGFMANAAITVQTFSPIPLSFVDLPGIANNVDVSGNHAYVAAGAAGLQVVDVTDREFPSLVGSFDTPGNANDVKVIGNLAYVADGGSGLQILDVSDPTTPAFVGTVDTPGSAFDVVVSGSRAYVADGSAGLRIIDVTTPTSPILLGSVATPGTAGGVDVDPLRMIAAVAAGSGGLQVVDISNPLSPSLLGSVPIGNSQDLVINGLAAVVADSSSSMTTVDLTDPLAPTVLSSTPRVNGGLLNDVTVAGRFAFGADFFFVNGVPIVDVGDPNAPVPRTILNFANFRDDNGNGIAADSSFVYLAANVGASARLYIGQYLALEDFQGIPPTVSITSPASGQAVIEGGLVSILVDAMDDIAVAGVNFILNGQQVFTDTAPPYQFTLSVPLGVTSLTFGAEALDLGGNIGLANDIQLSVIPDPLTTVIGMVIDEEANPVVGASVSTFNNLSSTTANDGTFTIPNVPTIGGSITVSVEAMINDELARGFSVPALPVLGGTTDVGQIFVRAGLLPGILTLLPFDDGNNPTVDLVGGHHGTLVGSAGFDTADFAPVRRNISSLDLKTSGSHVVLNDATAFDFGPGKPMTIAHWLKQTTTRGTFHVYGKRASCSTIQLQLARDSRQVHFSSGSSLLFLGADFPLNRWIHVAVTYDGGSVAKIYIDGQERASNTSFVMGGSTADPLKIGTSGTCSSSQTFLGLIDDFQVFDRALAPEDISVLAFPLRDDQDGDGFTDDVEIELGSNPLDPNSIPDFGAQIGEASAATISTLNQADPSGLPIIETTGLTVSTLNQADPSGLPINETNGLTASVGNMADPSGPALSEAVGAMVSVFNDQAALQENAVQVTAPLSGAETLTNQGGSLIPSEGLQANIQEDTRPPLVSLSFPSDTSTFLEGETILVKMEAEDVGQIVSVNLLVNDKIFSTDFTFPYEFTFTLPYGVEAITLGATAEDETGNLGTSSSVLLFVKPDPLATVEGRLVDQEGQPIRGATVQLQLHGLQAEFFDYHLPLNSMPKIRKKQPQKTKFISTLNFLNPDGLFVADTFGEEFDPDYAIKFSGWLNISESGSYRFILGADDGAELLIDEGKKLAIKSEGDFQEREEMFELSQGLHPVSVIYYQAVGDAEIQLSYIPPGGERQVVPLTAFTQPGSRFEALTRRDGTFTISDVPTILGDAQLTITLKNSKQRSRRDLSLGIPAIQPGKMALDTIMVPSHSWKLR